MHRALQDSKQTGSGTPVTPTYRRLAVTVRPPRLATVIPDLDDWVAGAQRMMENYSAIWGGRGDLLVPSTNSGELPTIMWRLLERFDPDRMGYYLPTFRGMQMANPAGFERWLDEQASRWATEHPDMTPEHAREQFSAPHILSSPLTSWQPPSSLAAEISRRLAPLDLVTPFELVWTADGKPGRELLELTNVQESHGKRLFTLRATHIDPRIDLMLTSHLGAIAPSYEEELEQINVALVEATVRDEHLGLVLGALWSADPSGYLMRHRQLWQAIGKDATPLWGPEDFKQTPFVLTELGCTSYVVGRPWTDEYPEVIVVGDTASDYCVFLALERMYRKAIWVPLSFLSSADELANIVKKQLAYHLHRVTGPGGRGGAAVFTSVSVDAEDFRDLATDIFRGDPMETDVRSHLDWVDLTELLLPKPLRLYDTEQVVRQSFEPFLGQEMAGALATPKPTGITDVRARNFTWHVDVAIDGAQFPPRACLNHLMAVLTETERSCIRASSDGASYFSLEPFFIPAGATVEQALYRPRLRLAHGTEIFQELLRAAGLRGVISQAGRFSQGCIDLWGGLDVLAADLADPARLALLEAYRAKSGSGIDPGVYLQGMRRRFLSFWDVRRATGLRPPEARSLLDDYVRRGILSRGLCLKCPRCSFAGWYAAEEVTQCLVCDRCRHQSVITGETWLKPVSEPLWFYQLDEIAFQALDHDVRGPVLALDHIRRESWAFLYAPEMLVYRQATCLCEVDLWAISDSAIIVGEAKTGDRLADLEEDERRLVRRLRRVAEAVTAHELLFATPRSTWSERTRRTVAEMGLNWKCRVRWLSGLGDTVIESV